jgi:nucleotide-binding universal stress UspA family protein
VTVYRKILIGYDGSAAGRKAFDTALELARKDGAELYVVSVARPLEIADDVEAEAVIENSKSHHRRLLAELRPLVAAAGVSTHFEVSVGHPAEQIIFDADRHGVDLIVVGDRGRSKFARLLLGSVSKQVVQYAGRAVLVVR